MNDDRKDANKILEAGLSEMRSRRTTESQVSDSAGRVHDCLQAGYAKVVPHPASDISGMHRIKDCEDYQALIPAYRSSSLTPARQLLIEDHLHECVSCRRAFEETRREPRGQTPRPRQGKRGLTPWFRWAAVGVAAALILLAFQMAAIRDFFRPIDVHAMVQTVDGGLYTASGQTVKPIAAGERIERTQVVRTGSESRAVLLLADGSRIEMSPRSQVWFDHARDGVRINVDRGDIVVTAAKQHGGHLYVDTRDLGVAVVGTAFEVSTGIRGSRVKVIEGEVRVQQGSSVQSLRPGQQFSSDTGGQDATVLQPRNTSDLVPLVPQDTVVFASLPNISQPLAESYQIFKQQLAGNPALAQWWQQRGNLSGLGPTLDQIIDRLTRAGSDLGSEVVFAFPAKGKSEEPVLLADTAMPDQLAAVLSETQAHVARTPGELQALAGSKGPVFYVADGLLIASSDTNQILRCLQFRSQPALNTFSSTPLYARLVQAYTEGVVWIVAADLERLSGNDSQGSLRQLVVEQNRGATGVSGYRAILAFNQRRTGIATWLAEPSPMGALEFISPAAYGVAGAVTRDPLSVFDEIASNMQGNAAFWQDFENYQREHRVDIRQDLVATLGNEFLVAVDGPILPTPGWRIVVEVNDAARLQNTIQWAITEMNQEAAVHQRQGLTLSSETAGGRTFYSVAGPDFPVEIHYTYWSGYMIIAPTESMLVDAIQNHDTGNSITRSAAFRSELPSDGHDYASAFIYQNVSSLMNSSNTLPTLVALYGEPDRIVLSSKGVLGTNVGNFTGIAGMLNFAGLNPGLSRK
jgi:FecR protein/Putative zinc-finger